MVEKIIEKGIAWLRDNTYDIKILEGWIQWGDRINYRLIKDPHEEFNTKFLARHEWILEGLESILEEAGVEVESDLTLLRETSFPNQDIPVFIATSSRPEEDFGGTFGDKVYPMVIPKGTKIFYISSTDRVRGRSDEESEQEFLLERGTTRLVEGRIVFSPSR